MVAYYNEIDPQAAQWLRNLIAAGLIAPGEVDERSIRDVAPGDLVGFTQCHFFAGIGVWSYAMRRAGWPDERPVWTGSCPCQPFSSAGKGEGFADPRHLWPAWRPLIAERRPGVVFGEQVSGKDGGAWIDLVQADVENLDYAFAAPTLPVAGFGSPHSRHRHFWVADAIGERQPRLGLCLQPGQSRRADSETRGCGEVGGVAHTDGRHAGAEGLQRRGQHGQLAQDGSAPRRLGDTYGARGQAGLPESQERQEGLAGVAHDAGCELPCTGGRPTAGWWSEAEWLYCRDEKWRPVEPGSFPLVDGAPSRLVRLRAYGNAIAAPVAEEFIRAYLEVKSPLIAGNN